LAAVCLLSLAAATRYRGYGMFKTARFKVHNPSRHKRALLLYALSHYHLTVKRVLEAALADNELKARVTIVGKNGKPRIDKAALSRFLYTVAPRGWPLAPLRDYLIGDVSAMLLSHYEKELKGKNESNPPSLHTLEALTEERQREALAEFAGTAEFPLKPEQSAEIEEARAAGQIHRAERLGNIYASRASANAVRDLLRSLETPLPRPIEFTRCEFNRGFLLARKGNNYYLLLRLFSKGNAHWQQVLLDEGFVNCRTHESIAGRKYPGVVLPLEFGRDFHEHEYLKYGTSQSAKLLVKRNDEGQEEIYAHIAFEFTPELISPESFLGIDRGAAMIGAATVIDGAGSVIARRIDLEGSAFTQELKRFELRIAEAQRKAQRRPRLFRLRKRWAAIVIGEYANRVVAEAVKNRSQIVLEKIDARSMARFLTRSQFRKLHDAISYKAERMGLPKPIEVPAAYTSQTCAQCGHRDAANRPKKDNEGRPLQALFLCVRCGYEANADENASEIIALRALHQGLNGGKFQKFPAFQEWLVGIRRRVGVPALIGGRAR
jgi:IS605 OrfB family transposase